MGKAILIIILLLAVIVVVASITLSVERKAGIIPDKIAENEVRSDLMNLGAYALKWAIKQVCNENITESNSSIFDNESGSYHYAFFEVPALDGSIDMITYEFGDTLTIEGGGGEGDDDDLFAEINAKLDELKAEVNAASMPIIIKAALTAELVLTEELRLSAEVLYNAGNVAGAKIKLGETKSQVGSFTSMVEISTEISPADKASLLAAAAEITEKIDEQIEYITTSGASTVQVDITALVSEDEYGNENDHTSLATILVSYSGGGEGDDDDLFAEINAKLDELKAEVNAASMPIIIKAALTAELVLTEELRLSAEVLYNAGNVAGAKIKLGETKSQVGSFTSMVEISTEISPADKASLLAAAAEITEKIDELIEYITTSGASTVQVDILYWRP